MKKLLLVFVLVFSSPAFATGIGAVTSAPCDNDTLNKYSGTVNAEINWEPNTIGLKWYNGDQQIAGQSSCVYDGTITVPPAPTKPGYTFNGWKVWKITVPDGYTQLEYLESTGTQYIDTGIKLTSDNVSYEWNAKDNNSASDTATTLFGSEYGPYANGNDDRLFTGVLYGRNTYRSIWVGFTRGAGIGYDSSDGNFHSWVLTITADRKASLTKDGVQKGSMSWTGESLNRHNTIALYGNRFSAGTVHERPSIALKYFKITDNGNVVFNGIPAKRNSDNVLGIFDTVSGTFKTNQGSGTFVAGPVVQ